MDDDGEIEKLLAESKLTSEKLKTAQKQKKMADLIIGICALLVIVGLILVFATSFFDMIMPNSSLNQRAIAVVSIFPFSFGLHALYTGQVINSNPGLFTNKNKSPLQYKVFTILWFGLGVFMLYISFK